MYLGLDAAASEFYVNGGYDLNFKAAKTGPVISGAELTEEYAKLCRDYPIVSIEDPFDQDDWESWAALTARVGDSTCLFSHSFSSL